MRCCPRNYDLLKRIPVILVSSSSLKFLEWPKQLKTYSVIYISNLICIGGWLPYLHIWSSFCLLFATEVWVICWRHCMTDKGQCSDVVLAELNTSSLCMLKFLLWEKTLYKFVDTEFVLLANKQTQATMWRAQSQCKIDVDNVNEKSSRITVKLSGRGKGGTSRKGGKGTEVLVMLVTSPSAV